MSGNKKPAALDKYVGERLRILRDARSLSQTDLGLGMGVTFQQVQKYETGTNRIGAARLMRAAKTLKVPITAFFDGGPGVGDKDLYKQ